MQKDIFDLNDIKDLPDSLRREIVRRSPLHKKVLTLFQEANRPLKIDEVMVGLYRKYGESLPRKSVMSMLYNISRSKKAFLCTLPKKKGLYQLTTEAMPRNGE